MYLVTGASGHLAQLVIEDLIQARGVPPSRIIATSRDPRKLDGLAARGVDMRAADFNDAAGLAKSFAGAERLLIVSTDALGEPGLRTTQHLNAVKAASAAGVQHILYTSMPEPEKSAVLFAPDHLATEQAIAASSIPGWTILRNNWYFENLLLAVPQALASGQWYSAAGDGGIAHIARADLAKAAAAALAGTSSGKSTLTLTGTKAYTTADIARLVSQAVGKPLNVVPVPEEALIQGMTAAGIPASVAQVFASFDTNTRKGGLAKVTADVRSLTGADPQSFETWLAANARAFG